MPPLQNTQPLELEEPLELPPEDEEEHIKYRESQLETEGIEPVIQQVGFPLKHAGDKARSVQKGVPPLQNTQPLELEEPPELLDDELDDDEPLLLDDELDDDELDDDEPLLLDDELDDDEPLLLDDELEEVTPEEVTPEEEQMKLELHIVLSVPLLAQHRGIPPPKAQVVP